MGGFSIGEVEDLLGLPASTLRHWESVISILGPRKDNFGRRFYSEAEIRLLFRLKHLSQRRGLGLREAGETVLIELESPGAEARSRLAEIRGELISLWAASREAVRRLEARMSRTTPARSEPADENVAKENGGATP
jgi:DNA-binding transcriptional MerR regulator